MPWSKIFFVTVSTIYMITAVYSAVHADNKQPSSVRTAVNILFTLFTLTLGVVGAYILKFHTESAWDFYHHVLKNVCDGESWKYYNGGYKIVQMYSLSSDSGWVSNTGLTLLLMGMGKFLVLIIKASLTSYNERLEKL